MHALLLPVLLTTLLTLPACATIRTVIGRTVTGTCEGACEHYLDCKVDPETSDRERCLGECPLVFSDRESLGAYESLSCEDAVSYVDGEQTVSRLPARPASWCGQQVSEGAAW